MISTSAVPVLVATARPNRLFEGLRELRGRGRGGGGVYPRKHNILQAYLYQKISRTRPLLKKIIRVRLVSRKKACNTEKKNIMYTHSHPPPPKKILVHERVEKKNLAYINHSPTASSQKSNGPTVTAPKAACMLPGYSCHDSLLVYVNRLAIGLQGEEKSGARRKRSVDGKIQPPCTPWLVSLAKCYFRPRREPVHGLML